MNSRRDGIRNAVENIHKCTATHVESVAVFERFAGKPVWEGVVDVFDLKDCPEANRCYAWTFEERGEAQYVAMLHRSPAISPATAVRAYLMTQKA
jgi:hypothetical protein